MAVALIGALQDAQRACAAGECTEAITQFETAVRLQPSDFRYYYRLGVCHGGACRFHALVHPQMAVPYFEQALRLVGIHRGEFRAAVLDQLAGALCRGGIAPRETALRAAIEYHLEASTIFRSLGMAAEWARTEFNLGNSCCELSEITGEDHWPKAIACYQRSLRVRTLERDPERNAAVLENLGTAYRRLSDRNTRDNVKKSIQCYRLALRIYTPAKYPGKSAALQNNLGNAFLSLPDPDANARARNARRALLHFDRALRIQSLGKATRAYGITQYNRAQAYCRLTPEPPQGGPQAAITCLKEAFIAFQACGEERYTALVSAQLERICP